MCHKGRLNRARFGERGFSLIELSIVMIVIAILVAVALPKYVSLDTTTKQDAVNAIAGALSSASSINYAAYKAGSGQAKTIANCMDVPLALTSNTPFPAGYTVVSQAVSVDQTSNCTLVHSDGLTTATFRAIGTP